MCSVCGARALAWAASRSPSAARWRTPKRCCSSTTATASAREADVGLDQRVRADDQRQLAARELAEDVPAPARGRRAGQQRGGSPARRRAAAGSSRSAARRASRSAPSAPPGGRARPRAASRTARPPSCRCRPRPSAGAASAPARSRSPAIASIALRWSPVSANGSPPRSQRSLSAPPLAEHRGARARPAPGAPAQEHQLRQQQLLERQPPAARLEVLRERAGSASPRARSRGRAAARSRGSPPRAPRRRRPARPWRRARA